MRALVSVVCGWCLIVVVAYSGCLAIVEYPRTIRRSRPQDVVEVVAALSMAVWCLWELTR